MEELPELCAWLRVGPQFLWSNAVSAILTTSVRGVEELHPLSSTLYVSPLYLWYTFFLKQKIMVLRKWLFWYTAGTLSKLVMPWSFYIDGMDLYEVFPRSCYGCRNNYRDIFTGYKGDQWVKGDREWYVWELNAVVGTSWFWWWWAPLHHTHLLPLARRFCIRYQNHDQHWIGQDVGLEIRLRLAMTITMKMKYVFFTALEPSSFGLLLLFIVYELCEHKYYGLWSQSLEGHW